MALTSVTADSEGGRMGRAANVCDTCSGVDVKTQTARHALAVPRGAVPLWYHLLTCLVVARRIFFIFGNVTTKQTLRGRHGGGVVETRNRLSDVARHRTRASATPLRKGGSGVGCTCCSLSHKGSKHACKFSGAAQQAYWHTPLLPSVACRLTCPVEVTTSGDEHY